MSESNLFPSLIGTLGAEIITLPICTVKTIYQNNPMHKSIGYTVKNIIETTGYKGFIQASPHAVLSQVISTSTKYTFYHKIKKFRQTDSNDLISNSFNGLVGGILGSFFSHPIDVWKNYVQRNEYFNWKSFNPKLYYQGYTASIYKNAVLYSCLFPLYDYYKKKFNNVLISSVFTTMTVSAIIQPFDYYKTVKMAGTNVKFDMGNIKQFGRGFNLMLLRSVPHFLITMGITEKIKKFKLNKSSF